jgi:hypothetical protein
VIFESPIFKRFYKLRVERSRIVVSWTVPFSSGLTLRAVGLSLDGPGGPKSVPRQEVNAVPFCEAATFFPFAFSWLLPVSCPSLNSKNLGISPYRCLGLLLFAVCCNREKIS